MTLTRTASVSGSPSGSWKSHKEDTVDWNDQKYGEIWRQGLGGYR